MKKNYRAMKFYKSLNSFTAVGLAEGFEEGTEDEVMCAWQYIWDRGLWRSLQGFFGRAVHSLLEQGLIEA